MHADVLTSLYRLTSPSGKSYIGVSVRPKIRFYEHRRAASIGSTSALYKAVRKYGWDKFKVDILARGGNEYIKELEIKAIAAFSCRVPLGYNITAGGDGTLGVSRSDEIKERIAASNRGQKRTEEQKATMRAARVGRKLSEEHKRNIGLASKLIVRTQEWKDKIGAAHRNKAKTDSEKAIRSASQRLKWQDPVYSARQTELQQIGLLAKRKKDND